MDAERELNEFPWATACLVALTLIVAIVGGAVVIIGNSELNFEDYVKTLGAFAVGLGLLGIGRGIRANGKFRR